MIIIRLRLAGEYWTDLVLAADGVTYKDSYGNAVYFSLWRQYCPNNPRFKNLYIVGPNSEANDGYNITWIQPETYIVCATP